MEVRIVRFKEMGEVYLGPFRRSDEAQHGGMADGDLADCGLALAPTRNA